MKNEIVKKNTSVLKKISNEGLSNIVKPLQKEIELFDEYISGVTLIDKKILSELQVGDILSFKCDTDNIFDDQAVMILNASNEKVGYIEEQDAIVCNKLLRAGKKLQGKIKSVGNDGLIPVIIFTLYLIDF